MKRYISKYALCPFYKHESKQIIDCEGIQDNTVIHIAFANATDSKTFKIRHCRDKYKECPIYAMIKRKYKI